MLNNWCYLAQKWYETIASETASTLFNVWIAIYLYIKGIIPRNIAIYQVAVAQFLENLYWSCLDCGHAWTLKSRGAWTLQFCGRDILAPDRWGGLFIPCEEGGCENTSLRQRCSLLYLVFPIWLKSEAATGGSLGGFWPGRPDAWSGYCHIIIRITDTRAVQNNHFSKRRFTCWYVVVIAFRIV